MGISSTSHRVMGSSWFELWLHGGGGVEAMWTWDDCVTIVSSSSSTCWTWSRRSNVKIEMHPNAVWIIRFYNTIKRRLLRSQSKSYKHLPLSPSRGCCSCSERGEGEGWSKAAGGEFVLSRGRRRRRRRIRRRGSPQLKKKTAVWKPASIEKWGEEDEEEAR